MPSLLLLKKSIYLKNSSNNRNKMGPCHSSSKKALPQPNINAGSLPPAIPNIKSPEKPSNIEQPKTIEQPRIIEQPINNERPADMGRPLSPVILCPLPENIENTPIKVNKEEPNPNSSNIKANNRYGNDENVEKSNIKNNAISKQDPNGNQDMKMGSHFYYNQKENDSGKMAERNLEFEEHEFKEPTDFKTSLHSNQLNRREIFSEINKNKFIQSKNLGDSDEPEEMVFS
jgi:hypothetical protein